MLESRSLMIRFSIFVLCLLLISLPFKLPYFQDGNTPEAEVMQRQSLVNAIAANLEATGFRVLPTQDDLFMPTAELYIDTCILRITPLPVTRDLDDSFAFENANFDGRLAYYYEGEFFTEPPMNAPRFWEYAARALPKIGISVRERIRLGVAYSELCDLEALNLESLDGE